MRNNLLSIVFFIGLFSNWHSLGQSQLPACPIDRNTYWHNCFGTGTSNNGDKYLGEWRDNMLNGQGTEIFSDGSKFVGQYEDGNRHGQGIYTYFDGAKYVGQYKENKRHGQGTFTFPSDNKYIGEFRDGKYNGKGTLYSSNGSIINQGIWEDGKFIPSEVLPQATLPKVVPPQTSQQIKQKNVFS